MRGKLADASKDEDANLYTEEAHLSSGCYYLRKEAEDSSVIRQGIKSFSFGKWPSCDCSTLSVLLIVSHHFREGFWLHLDKIFMHVNLMADASKEEDANLHAEEAHLSSGCYLRKEAEDSSVIRQVK
ncbi:hypothetical protein CEXT_507321 [Caerostris extrusa]|uniref:Uncharacterized protein n=1 Tax=Caerostris extrusa TaxID=172846 RepID=A0AAV4M797_CAEEX|nr:hypothetical protein CEXT_507321 [Caerostris extrusa]